MNKKGRGGTKITTKKPMRDEAVWALGPACWPQRALALVRGSPHPPASPWWHLASLCSRVCLRGNQWASWPGCLPHASGWSNRIEAWKARQWCKIGTKWVLALEVNIFSLTCDYTNTVQIHCPFKTIKPSCSRASPSRPLPQGNRWQLSLGSSTSTSQEAPGALQEKI